MYAVDSTSPESGLKEVRSFIRNAIKPYNLRSGETRADLITYGMQPRRLSYSGIGKAGLSLASDLIEHTPGERDIVQTLNFIRNSLYKQDILRKNARKLVVLFVNGNRAIPNLPAIESTFKSLNASGIGYIVVIVNGPRAMLAKAAGKHGTVVHSPQSDVLPDAYPFVIKAGFQAEGKQFDNTGCFAVIPL